ncbi:MAG: hypothetical protein IJ764_05675 [Bacteroidales bacterium]|nr:hypothetical protein [Bacteroidales bacterium]
MMYRQFTLLISAILALPLILMSQNGVNSPFSQYGLSQNKLPGSTPFAAAMGGVVYSRASNNYVNPFNPASYASIQKESFVFDISMSLDNTHLTGGNQTSNSFDGALSSLAVAFPLTNWWKTSLGLLPYSTTKYETVVQQSVTGTSQLVRNVYDGTGGISQVYWGNGFNIIGGDEGKPTLQAGFNLNYLYGNVSRAITYDFVGSDTSYYQDTRRQKNTRVSNVTFDIGLLYRQPLNEKYTLTAAVTCKLPQTLTVKDESLIYTFITTSGTEHFLDTIFPARGESSKYDSKMKQPMGIGVGLAIERNHRWEVAVDAYYAEHSGMKYEEGLSHPIFGNSGLQYKSNCRIAIGGGWLGNPEAVRYIGRMGLTGGIHYEKGKLSLDVSQTGNTETLDEWGVGMGITFPMRKGRSQFVLSCAYTNFGETDLLCTETFSIGFTLSSNERWFVKRKYN